MLCSSCGNGYICEPTPKPFVITYRGFSKQTGAQLYPACSNCLYEATEPLESNVDMDSEMIAFKREINMKLSTGGNNMILEKNTNN